jgi:hypothetical protein
MKKICQGEINDRLYSKIAITQKQIENLTATFITFQKDCSELKEINESLFVETESSLKEYKDKIIVMEKKFADYNGMFRGITADVLKCTEQIANISTSIDEKFEAFKSDIENSLACHNGIFARTAADTIEHTEKIANLIKGFNAVRQQIEEHKAEVLKYLRTQDDTIEAIRKRQFSFFYDRTQALADHLGLWFGFKPATPATEASEILEPKPGAMIPVKETTSASFFGIACISGVCFLLGLMFGFAIHGGLK